MRISQKRGSSLELELRKSKRSSRMREGEQGSVLNILTRIFIDCEFVTRNLSKVSSP